MSCEDCEYTLPCYGGKLTMSFGGGQVTRVHACPFCARIFIVNEYERWWETIQCEVREGVIKQARIRVKAGYGFEDSLRDYNPPDHKVNQMLCDTTVDDPGPGTKFRIWACPTCANPVRGGGVPRYVGIRKKWLHDARQFDTGVP